MMVKTRSKSKTSFISVNIMAASVLLLLGLFYSHAGAVSAAPDIKVNGMDNTVTLASENTLTVTVQLNAGEQTGEQADWWIIAATPMGWYYYEYPDMWHLVGGSMEDVGFAYQGALFNLTEPLEVLRVSGLPVGNYAFYFGVDMIMNGTLTGGDALYFDGVEVNISASGGFFPVVDTGQTACYDDNGDEITCPESGEAFAGQDAQYDGNQMSYSDNGDGTITDNATGLMWQQTPGNRGLSWQEAVDYCESQELAGYDDWRIPTLKELFSISDFSKGWPYLNTTYFDLAGTSVSKDEQYWADYYVGTTVEGGSEAAFGVNHGTGHIKAYPANVSGRMGNYVRAVRGNTYGVNVFVDNGDSTITDNATGLMWQQADSGTGMDWENALAYAESSTLAGHDDWRLPNIKELQSIVDYTHSPSASDEANLGPAIDTDFFQITELPSGTTNYSTDYGYFWSSTSAYFGPQSPEYYYAWYVAFGTAVDDNGDDFHGAGAVRFDTKVEGGPASEGDERCYNYVRLVRNAGL